MKKLFTLFMIFIITISFVSCKSNNNDLVIIEDEYEYAEDDWTPIGKEIKKGKFCAFSGDEQFVFIKEKSLFSEGIIYHKKNDAYPNITTSKIMKVVLSEGNQDIIVDDNYYKYFQNGFFENTDELRITKDDCCGSMLFANLYFINYPAYYTSYYFTKTVNNMVVVRYCEEAMNYELFGNYNSSIIITDKELSDYLLEIL